MKAAKEIGLTAFGLLFAVTAMLTLMLLTAGAGEAAVNGVKSLFQALFG